PSDAGADFTPKEFVRKEVAEESRGINVGKGTRREEDEESLRPDPEDGQTPEPVIEETGTSEELPPEEPVGPDASENGGSEVQAPVPHNPDFEPLAEPDPTVRRVFSRWVVTQELHEDGTFAVIEEDGGYYHPVETPEDKSPEDLREEILSQARTEAEELHRKAKEEGYKEGYSQGVETAREELRAEMVPVFEELRNSIKTVLDYRGEIFLEAEKEIFELVLLFSQKVLHSELQIRPEVIVDVIRHALKRAVGWGEATVRVNPEDYEFLEKHRLLLNEGSEGVVLTRIEADPGVSRGGCVLESNFGEIDVRLEKQVDAVEKALREALSEKMEEYEEQAEGEGRVRDETAGPPPETPPAGDIASAPADEEEPEPGSASVRPYQPKDLASGPEEASEGEDAQ
ncbi:FliH/SctL family protein, partial [Nitrospinota bacterium]